jgi:SAM-dependent methyltransferase
MVLGSQTLAKLRPIRKCAMTQADFKDHFSGIAAQYAKFRPEYPDALFDDLAARAHQTRLAWDCGCGGGQATKHLARLFDAVIATDPSAEQLKTAPSFPNVTYDICAAEDAPVFKDHCVDMIVAAQAAHWFDLTRYYAEVRRIAAPKAVLALITYRPTQIADPAANQALQHFYSAVVGPYWPPDRRHVEEGYQSLDFPFVEDPAPDMRIDVEWDLERLVGYAGTWSAVKEYRRQRGEDPLPLLRAGLAPVWGEPDATKAIFWPLACRITRLP